MANHITSFITFFLDYDGVTTTIAINTKTGYLGYGPNPYGIVIETNPLFNSTATGVENVVVGNNNVAPVSATATISGGVLTVTIPSGLSAGSYFCQATLIY